MVHVAIVDDDKKNLDYLSDFASKYQEEFNENLKITTFSDGADIAEEYKAEYDIIILDIKMPFMDGMRAAELIRAVDSDVIIIFITNMAQYAIKGYSVQAMNFLLKPVSYFAFSQELQKAVTLIKERKKAYLVIRIYSGMARLNVDEIEYVESKKHQIIVHTKNNSYSTRDSLKNVEKNLSQYKFIRCNNSYLVNLRYVEGIDQNNVIVGGDELQISRPRKKIFMEALADYVGGAL
ncbi:MAG: Response regulator of the LytR/AlgR family [Anaerocolumna sp.]|jgi:DNA-binding LytR/AlgR family response regulator|nr:Response regulator of the LytR/AlgR family [Anaerocolumna sp.]